MSDVTELRCWPSCIDALDWSQDGIIALASDERVELLFPNTVSYDRDQEDAQWQHIPLQVPWFTSEELPLKPPAPLPDYSIGEEISSSAPIAIAWSPTGLAKHRRCALAVLTANLVLSIWAADGRPQEASSWDRKLMVNNALIGYFLTKSNGESGHGTASLGERTRLRTRVRAFTWAPALPNSHSFNTLGSQIAYGRHILAICNDDNQLALLAIESPTTTHGADSSWKAEVLTHVSLVSASKSISAEPLPFADRMKQQKHISQISWSPWIIQNDLHYAIIVYATNEDVRARLVTYTHGIVELGDEIVYSNIEMRYNGSMKWGPVIDDSAHTLALFTSSGLIYLTISTHDASIIKRATHDLDGRWDQVSGAIWDLSRQSTPCLHVSSMLSTIQNPTAVLETAAGTLTAVGCPSWRDQLENSASLFSAKNDLKGNVKLKVWGMTTSPLGDFVATCHSTHPSDMIEYGSPADRRGTVAVTALSQYRQIRESFPARNVSAEGVLFTLKKIARNTVEDGTQISTFVDGIAEKLLKIYGPDEAISDSDKDSLLGYSELKLNEVVQRVKRLAFFDPQTLKDRYTILTSHACNVNSNDNLQRLFIAYRLATTLQNIPAAPFDTAFSAEIRNHHQKMINLVQKLSGLNSAPLETTASEESGDQVEVEAAVQFAIDEAMVDICDFCAAPIALTDLATATCMNGHQFPRCGLSLLAIQAPGITKYCGICSTPFLNDEFVVAQERKERQLREQKRGQEVERDHPIKTDAMNSQQRRDGSNGVTGIGDVTMESTSREEDQPQNKETEYGQEAGCENPAQVIKERETREFPVTFAKLLFLANDACIYCGGKFVG